MVSDSKDEVPRFEDSIPSREDASSIFRESVGGEGGVAAANTTADDSPQAASSIEDALKSVAATLEADLPNEAPSEGPSQPLEDDLEDDSRYPKQPRTVSEVGLSKAFLTDLTLKIMHYSGTPSAGQLMRRLGLGGNLVQQIIDVLQEERLCEVLSQSDLYTGNYRYRLSERGTTRAMEALERTRYAGAVPVTAEQYAEVIREQQTRRQTTSRDQISDILQDMVLAPETSDAIARALHSGKTTLMYGPSGNGKTWIMEHFSRALSGVTLVPYAIYAYGQVIRVFDPSIHEPVEELDDSNITKDSNRDRRWVLVRQPAVFLGSQLGSESLDLAYDPQARFYQAPPHVKSQGGVLVVDDLGRQKASPGDLMARWLIPMERGWDSLSLNTGEKLSVPFDVQLLFGTNQPIDQLVDDAMLRRILYKVEMPNPGPDQFAEILQRLCRQRNVHTPDGAVERVVERLYSQPDDSPRAAYARDLLEIVVEGAAYDGQEPVLDEESFERAYRLFRSQHRSA